MNAAVLELRPIDVHEHELLIAVIEKAEEQGLILVTDGKDMKYTLPNHIPAGWTRFAMKMKPRLLEPKEPRA